MEGLLLFSLMVLVVAAVVGLVVAGIWNKSSGQSAFWTVCFGGAFLFFLFRHDKPALGIEYVTSPTGAILTSVSPSGTAWSAGLRPGMAVVSAGGIDLTQGYDFGELIQQKHPGDLLHLTVMSPNGMNKVDVFVGTK